MPDLTGVDLTEDSTKGPTDLARHQRNVEEMALAGVGAEDILASGVDLDQDLAARNAYFNEALLNVDLSRTDIDMVSWKLGYTGNEGAAGDLFAAASTTSDKLGNRSGVVSEDVDELQQGRFGSEEVALSVTAREDGWATYDPFNEEGGWENWHIQHHDTDGIDSDYRTAINAAAIRMHEMGEEWGPINQALAMGGTMLGVAQMREALVGLSDIAASRAGFSAMGAFFERLDSDLLAMQKADDPKGNYRPALGTEPETEAPAMQATYRPPENQPDGPNSGRPGMAPNAPTIMV